MTTRKKAKKKSFIEVIASATKIRYVFYVLTVLTAASILYIKRKGVHRCNGGVQIVRRRYKHIMACNAIPIEYNYHDHYNLYVVYFVNCKIHNGYGLWMEEQLKYVPENALLKIVAVSSKCKEEKIQHEKFKTVLGNRPNPNSSTLLECHDEADDEPTFEYYGIRAMWEVGQMRPHRNTVVFYFHSKGLTHWKTIKEYKQNAPYQLSINKITLGQVDRVFEAFDLFPEINKAGAKVAGNGWVWYNFMFARGSYLKRVEEPILTGRRYYYEDWIGRTNFVSSQGVHPANATERDQFLPFCDATKQDGYNLDPGEINVGVYYDPSNNKWYKCEKSGERGTKVHYSWLRPLIPGSFGKK